MGHREILRCETKALSNGNCQWLAYNLHHNYYRKRYDGPSRIISRTSTIYTSKYTNIYQQVGILISNYREQTDYVFRKKTRKAQDQPTELNIQEIDQTEEFSSIPVNETTNSNAGTQNSSIRPKKKPRQKSQVQHSQEIQAQMNTQTQPPQVTHNTDNTQTNQGAINIQKQVVVNNFNCSNTSLSGQSKSQSTNKSEVARKSQNQQNPKQTAPKQVSQTKTPVQKPKEAPQAPLPQETKKTQSQIPLVKSKHTSETSSQSKSSTVSSGTQVNQCNITIEVEAQASELTQVSTMRVFDESRFQKENEFRNSNYIFGGYRPLILLMKYKIFPHHK
ncbi:Hypothetical_protein [Hexamita inflata]|uniref:Hypothetical_protein n=1 Tax=Hexamita inflata TaxID=28002 RepID=A0AA86QJ44_9EUKA|nr:Hypothetical protein HINF_LOCUS44877 [Hexamita inflata]